MKTWILIMSQARKVRCRIEMICVEIFEYARFIGMSPRTDAKYLYIAREALKTPLPPPWKPASTPDGQLVYLDLKTGEVSDEHPLD
jgi:centrosomal protein CEP164